MNITLLHCLIKECCMFFLFNWYYELMLLFSFICDVAKYSMITAV